MTKQQNRKVSLYSFITTVIATFVVSFVVDIPWIYFPYWLVGIMYTTQYIFQQLIAKQAENQITLARVIILLVLLIVTAAIMSLLNLSGNGWKVANIAALLVDCLIFYAIFRR